MRVCIFFFLLKETLFSPGRKHFKSLASKISSGRILKINSDHSGLGWISSALLYKFLYPKSLLTPLSTSWINLTPHLPTSPMVTHLSLHQGASFPFYLHEYLLQYIHILNLRSYTTKLTTMSLSKPLSHTFYLFPSPLEVMSFKIINILNLDMVAEEDSFRYNHSKQ